MTDHYIDTSGKYIGGFGDGAAPEDISFINLGDEPPEYADQVWLFPGWGKSLFKAAQEENQWRNEQMPIARNNVTAIEYGEPGDSQAWKDYWLALRKWTADNPDFPDCSKRPAAP